MCFLREISISDRDEIMKMKVEVYDFDNNFEGFSELGRCKDFLSWYDGITLNKSIDKVRSDLVPQTTYIMVNDNNEVIGGINIRHYLNESLINHGGNIGYLIRPKFRGMGMEVKCYL